MAANQEWMNKDFYKGLGVSKDASDADIKKAYRKLARQYHPDRNPGDSQAEERFKEVGEAYQVLSNAEDRKQYDAIRSFAGGGSRFTSGGGGTTGGFEDIFSQMFGGNGQFKSAGGSGAASSGAGGAGTGGFEEIFSMFGGSSQNESRFGGFGSARRSARGADISAQVSIPLRKAVDGTTVKLTTTSGKSITAKVPAGVHDGQKIRIAGKGNPGTNGGAAGDIIVTVHVEKHPVFELKGADVYVDLPVSFAEAALGATVDVPILDGSTVSLKVPAGSSTNKLLRVKGKGMQQGRRGHGDLYVRLAIAVPAELSDEAERAAKLFAAATREIDPRADFMELARS